MIWQIPINGYDNNFSYFVGGVISKGIAIVDPGDVSHLVDEIDREMLRPQMILLTHTHFDHTSGVAEIVERYGIPVYMHKNARDRLEVAEDMTILLEDGDEVDIGGFKLEVMHTPGHIDDALCFYVPKSQDEDGVPRLITGDTLFVEACGRADLEHSNVEELYQSLERLKKLPGKTRVYPGHDYGSKPVSDIDWEKKHNKYLLCKNVDEFVKLRLPTL